MRPITNGNVNDLTVNSHHHQTIKKIGENLSANAFATDEVYEGIEDTREDKFVSGVQWHPELSWKTDELLKSIFAGFAEKCANFSWAKEK